MPPRLTAQDFDQDLLILFDAYVHGDLDRRAFRDRAQRFAKAGVTAAGLPAALSPDFAAGQQVRAGDARLKTEWVSGTQHGFHNDPTPRYDASAARLAWERTIALLKLHLA